MNYLFSAVEILLMIGLLIITKKGEKYITNKFRILYAVPFFTAVVMILLAGFDVYFLGVYIASVLPTVGLFTEKTDIRKAISVICTAMIVISIFVNALFIKRTADYESDFDEAFATLREHYVLADEKGIDWDELYTKYKPRFAEVTSAQDFNENYRLWMEFTGEFYDGHTAYYPKDDSKAVKALAESFGDDFGLSIARLSTGEYVAVNVEGYDNSYSILSEEEDPIGLYLIKPDYEPENVSEIRLTLKNAGVKNGTVITKWNGKGIDEYFEDVKYYINQYPVRENEEFFLPVYASGIGENMAYGETSSADDETFAVITYLDESGVEKEIKVPKLGAYMPRLYSTIKKIDAGKNITNMSWEKLSDDTMLLRISQMAYDQKSYADPNEYTEMKENLRGEIIALKEEGVKNIIFDMRSNTGGDPFFVEAVVSYFAPVGEHICEYSSVINEKTATYERGADGKYIKGDPLTFTGEDLWHDGNVILLVNDQCVSAGDEMTYMMGEYPNVKVYGFTRTNSSCQAVTQIELEEGILSFSAVPNLDENSEVIIDTRTDRIGRTPFDEYIPFDHNAVTAIFDRGEDYQIDYLLNLLNMSY